MFPGTLMSKKILVSTFITIIRLIGNVDSSNLDKIKLNVLVSIDPFGDRTTGLILTTLYFELPPQ